MKKRVILMLAGIIACVVAAGAQTNAKKAKLPDTTGLANIETRLDQFKQIVQDMSDKMNKSGSLDTVKIYAHVIAAISDTILNHIAPVFDGYYALHPDQYVPLKNVSDIAEKILDVKDIAKAKKLEQKMAVEYGNLLKAK